MPIKQHGVHTNGKTVTTYYQKANYTQGSYSKANYTKGSYNKANYTKGGSGHSKWNEHNNWGDWWDAWGRCNQTGGSCRDNDYYSQSYSNSGSYSKSYSNSGTYSKSYSDYGQSTTTYNETTDQNNKSPQIPSGIPTSGTPNWGTNKLTIDLTSIDYSDPESNAKAGYRIYYNYKSSTNESWGTWTLIGANESTYNSATTTSTSYDWNITNLAQGYYKIAVTVFDGNTWSAILNTAKTNFTNHHRQAFVESDTGASSNPRTIKTAIDKLVSETTYYAESSQFSLFKYVPPTWLTDPWKKATIDQLREEINTARETFGLTTYTFSNIPVVEDFTLVRVTDITEAQSAVNEVLSAAGKPIPTYEKTPTLNNTEVSIDPIAELQNLLDSLSK